MIECSARKQIQNSIELERKCSFECCKSQISNNYANRLHNVYIVQLLVKYFEFGSFTSHLAKIDAAKQWRLIWKIKSAQDQCSVDIIVGFHLHWFWHKSTVRKRPLSLMVT